MELATDLASLALYDIVIYADDSGSMIFEEGGDRINDLKLILGRVAEVDDILELLNAMLSACSNQVTDRKSLACGQVSCICAVHLATRRQIIHTTALQVATLFDDDGIVVRFMNSMTEGNGIRDAASASALVQEVCSWGCHAAGLSYAFCAVCLFGRSAVYPRLAYMHQTSALLGLTN